MTAILPRGIINHSLMLTEHDKAIHLVLAEDYISDAVKTDLQLPQIC